MKKIILMKKTVLISGAALVIAFLGWKIYDKAKSGDGSGPGAGNVAVAVEIAPIKKSSLRDLGHFTGTLIAKSHVVVAPKIAGRLNRLLVDIGDAVRSGQLLAVLEDEEYRQQVIQAEADLRVAAANLEEARSSLTMADRNLERARTLHQTGIQSDAQLDQVLAQQQAQSARYNVAVAQLANREAALESSRVRLSYTQIRTSWDRGGPVRFVGERFADEGAMLSVNNPILSIIELQPVTAVINVTDREYFRLKIGQAAVISGSAFPKKAFNGRIVRIAPLLQEASRQARVEVEVENPQRLLKPGMFVNTQIEFARRADVTIVPFNALAKREDQQGIFLVDMANSRARFLPVQTGIVEGGQVEIVAPENLSGYVVTLGHYLLEAEGRIILPAPAAAAGQPKDGVRASGDGR
ncbi:MAG: efflux RND transporter periplasmic adaptor subunit [Candidatus Aminicenantes bacterium]|nr:efflux RND transporter periplasmic adaptor subunit [Candidatus Aminicenantes bacterium]